MFDRKIIKIILVFIHIYVYLSFEQLITVSPEDFEFTLRLYLLFRYIQMASMELNCMFNWNRRNSPCLNVCCISTVSVRCSY